MQVGEKERTAQLERVHNEVISIIASKLVDPRTKRVYTSGMIEKALDMLSSMAHQQQQQQQQQQQPQPQSSDNNPSTPTTPGTPAPAPDSSSDKPEEKEKPRPTWTGVSSTKSAKSQALDAMRALIAHQPIPLARARMRLRITCSTNVLKQGVKAPKGGVKDAEGGEGEHKAPGTVKDKILSFVEQVESQDVVGSEWEVVGFVEPGAFKGLSDFVGGETKGQGRIEVLDMAVTHEED
jgi:ribosome maturation protein SDO1